LQDATHSVQRQVLNPLETDTALAHIEASQIGPIPLYEVYIHIETHVVLL
jgi:hypothetical protein